MELIRHDGWIIPGFMALLTWIYWNASGKRKSDAYLLYFCPAFSRNYESNSFSRQSIEINSKWLLWWVLCNARKYFKSHRMPEINLSHKNSSHRGFVFLAAGNFSRNNNVGQRRLCDWLQAIYWQCYLWEPSIDLIALPRALHDPGHRQKLWAE